MNSLTLKDAIALRRLLRKAGCQPIGSSYVFLLRKRGKTCYPLDGKDWQETEWGYELKPEKRYFSKRLLKFLKPQLYFTGVGSIISCPVTKLPDGKEIHYTKYVRNPEPSTDASTSS